MNDLGAWLTFLSGVLIAGITAFGQRLNKKTPEAISPSQIQSEIIDDLRDQINQEREARIAENQRQASRIDALEAKVDKYSSWILVLKGRVTLLEGVLRRHSIEVPARTVEEQKIFDGYTE